MTHTKRALAAAALTATLLAGALPAAAASDVFRVTTVDDALRAAASARVDAMSLRERAASIVMGHIPTTDAAQARAYLDESGIGGFILMGANIGPTEGAVRAFTAALSADAEILPLIAIDQEGGIVSRLPWDDFASPRTLRTAPVAETREAFAARGALVARAGANLNFGVIADYTADTGSFIYPRTLGDTPEASAERVVAAAEAEAGVVATTIKHFPGHGAAPGDSHTMIPHTTMSLDDWRATEAVPFAAGIEAGVPIVMFGHLAYTEIDALPASLSPRWHEILRQDLGFEGVAVTDDLGMLQASGLAEYADPVANAVRAVAAGNDLVLSIMFTDASTADTLVTGLVAAVESGELPADRLRQAAWRVMTLRLAETARGATMQPCPECAPVAP